MPAAGAAPAPVSTPRLLVRPLTADDDGALLLLRFRGNPAAVRYLSHAALSPEENTARLGKVLTTAAASTAEWFNLGRALQLRASGEVIGDGRTWNSDSPPPRGAG